MDMFMGLRIMQVLKSGSEGLVTGSILDLVWPWLSLMVR
jgi:hypothetical protein